MINKKLIKLVPDASGHIRNNVTLQIIGLVANIIMMFSISYFISDLINSDLSIEKMLMCGLLIIALIIVKVLVSYFATIQSFLASKSVKNIIRNKIYDKIVRMGEGYNKKVSTAELLQMSIEGVEQLETYFGGYLPQFFYSMIAPLILFVVVSFINLKIAFVLFICVPLIPVSIIVIQKIAKRLLSKYWGEYSKLADNFLENLQGLNTLKIYSSDEFKHQQMNKQAEKFRVVTMKVLSMQLNSIIVMDVVAYGGAALGIIITLLELNSGSIEMVWAFAIIMLAADFFLPLRILGSFFHIAMNGIAASKKIFNLLALDDQKDGNLNFAVGDIKVENLSFAYDQKVTLKDLNLEVKEHSFVSIVGKSGCGKSTLAKILIGTNLDYLGSVKVGGVELSNIKRESLFKNVTLVVANSYIFKGTVRDNLLLGNVNATEDKMWEALKKVNLSEFLKGEDGLETILLEKGSNFSGGQAQRLAIARALLHDSEVYIFDEATSNIDSDSENEIMKVITKLAQEKTVILISHRLLNCVNSDIIYVLKEGVLVEEGTHQQLVKKDNYYYELWNAQQSLENMRAE